MSSIKFDPIAGTNIDIAIEHAISMAEITGVPVDLTFNGTEVRIETSHVSQVKRIWEQHREFREVQDKKVSPGIRCQCGERELTLAIGHTDYRGTRIHSAQKCWWQT